MTMPRTAQRTLRRTPVEGVPTETPSPHPGPPDVPARGIAEMLEPFVSSLLGAKLPIRVEFWDGTALGPEQSDGALIVRSVDALKRVVGAPGELGVARAFVAGDLDVRGDAFDTVIALRDVAPKNLHFGPAVAARALGAARRVGALRVPPPPPPEEIVPARRRHTRSSDARAIKHHYDVSNEFYALLLGPSMVYSCARFERHDSTLEQAQEAKLDLVCRKLGLHQRPGSRLLDVGCGWGSLAIHAAVHQSATVVGITISQEQAEAARRRVEEAGVGDRVDIRLMDYRELGGETFDAISSVGMFEHVGAGRMQEYFDTLYPLLRPEGRLLNHAISSIGGSRLGHRSFMGRYVFPDGELIDVGEVVLAMERAGFEVRDVESLREHYARTLRAWIANLERNWDEAVRLVGEGRARVWRLYMAASAVGFTDGGVSIHQTLGVVHDPHGSSGMPLVSRAWQ